MKVQFNLQHNILCGQTFQGRGPHHGARNIGQVMNKLYRAAYSNQQFGHYPDVIQISTKMRDGVEVAGLATFNQGQFVGISFPYEMAHYRKEFCNSILSKYNLVATKGKYKK